MKNYVQDGHVLNFTAPADLAAGEATLIGAKFAVAVNALKTGEVGPFRTGGVFRLPKAAVAVAEGAKLYWVTASKHLSTTASGNTLVGYAAAAAADSAATVECLLNTSV